LVFSAASMSQKVGASLGMAALGGILTIIGYKAGQDQTAKALHGLRLMLSLIPAGGATLAALFMFIYPLSEKKMKDIEQRLAERRAAVETEKTV
jgi:glycoside/pentoside/hexuronide:cation symporter, GPH family